MKDGLPILYVVHDSDGEWQFLPGVEVGMQHMMIVGLDEVKAIDPTLEALMWMAPRTEARRGSVEDDWTIGVFEERE